MPPPNPIFERQGWHIAGLAALIAAVSWAAEAMELPGTTRTWLILTMAAAALHQGWVWLCWRVELHTGGLTRRFGDRAFAVYRTGFQLAALMRLGTVVAVAWADRGSLGSHAKLLTLIGLVLLAPIGYLHYSVTRYFTFRRALGADHFDPAYRTMPLETRGIFRYTRNGMYTFGLLMVWLPGLFFASQAALLAAAFHHAYAWVHYYCTELPDMRRIYGPATLTQKAV